MLAPGRAALEGGEEGREGRGTGPGVPTRGVEFPSDRVLS